MEIDKKDHLLKQGMSVLDLGASPGGWSQYVCEKTGSKGTIVAVDILPMKEIEHVKFINGDFTENSVYQQCLEEFNNRRIDLVISDMAPNLSGIRVKDQANSIYLAELSMDMACKLLKPGGNLLVKVFQGEGVDGLRNQLKAHFDRVLIRKPQASRDSSREFYILSKQFTL